MMAKRAAHTFVHQEVLSERTDSLCLNEQARAIKIFPLHQYSEDHNVQNLFMVQLEPPHTIIQQMPCQVKELMEIQVIPRFFIGELWVQVVLPKLGSF